MQLLIATFNLRNINDRYDERKPLLAGAFAALAPDIIGLQEVVFTRDRQDDFLARQVVGKDYRRLEARSGRYPNFGNAILCGAGEVQAHEELRLSHDRVAHRALIALPGNRMLWFANTHLHHVPGEPEVRVAQVQSIRDWMAAAPAAHATVVAGDFNTPPSEPAYAAMTRAGYRSAYAEAKGSEPAVTWPSGIQAPTIDTDGDPNCLDYLWLSGDVRATAARLAFNDPAPHDATLYPSDHFAIVAEISI
ncbi:MAG: endonuclease/exonuclease/phosphatase family protein [Tepidiformaceae bacterium]